MALLLCVIIWEVKLFFNRKTVQTPAVDSGNKKQEKLISTRK